jgi:Putative zinc-finger
MPDDKVRPPVATHLEPDVVAAYVDGKLDRTLREHVQTHLAECDECYELVSEVVQTEEALGGPAESERPFVGAASRDSEGSHQAVVVAFARRRSVIVAVGSMLAAAAAFLIVVQVQPQWWVRLRGDSEPDITELANTMRRERTVAGRLAGIAWSPLSSPTRGGVTPAPPDTQAAAAAILQRDQTQRTVADSTAAAALLALGRSTDAVARLTQSTPSSSDRTKAAINLSASHIERFRETGNQEHLKRAIALTRQILAATPRSSEALFNLALALELTGDRAQGESAWQAYLDVDPSSLWAAEAKLHLSALTR